MFLGCWGAAPQRQNHERPCTTQQALVPSPPSASQLPALRAPLKTEHLGFSQPSDPGWRGCACCELVRQECQFFQEDLSPVSSFSHGLRR